MSKFYIGLNSFLNSFIKIKCLTTIELEEIHKEIINEISLNLTEDKTPLLWYKEHLVSKTVIGYKTIVKKFSATHEHETIIKTLFESITDIYPEAELSSFCDNFNETLTKKLIQGIEKEITELQGDSFVSKVKNTSNFEKVKRGVSKNILGQEKAIDSVFDGLKLLVTGYSDTISFFFIGTTGVGKTELAKVLASELYKDEPERDKLVKINCAEYSSNHEYAKLIGSPPGYIGYSEPGLLTQKAGESNSWILLFDEIEKASDNLINLLLNLLDEGYVVDGTGNKCDFSKSIIIFTSNIGIANNVGKNIIGFGKSAVQTFEEALPNIQAELEAKFSPEFRNRINKFVYFNTLTEKDAKGIIKLYLKKFKIKATPSLVKHILDESFDTTFGARNIKRFIKSNILTKLADAVLDIGVENKEKYKFNVKYSKDNGLIVDKVKKNGQDL